MFPTCEANCSGSEKGWLQQETEAPSEAWVRFVEDKFGQEVRVPTARGPGASQRTTAAAGEGEKGDVPNWRRFLAPDFGEGSMYLHLLGCYNLALVKICPLKWYI